MTDFVASSWVVRDLRETLDLDSCFPLDLLELFREILEGLVMLTLQLFAIERPLSMYPKNRIRLQSIYSYLGDLTQWNSVCTATC